MSLQAVPLNDFRGGLNTRDGPFDLQKNESPDLLNVTISSLVGQLETRKGKELVEEEILPNEKVDHAKQAVIGAAGKRFLMLSVDGDVWALTPLGLLKKLHVGTAAAIWDFEVYADAAGKDWVYMSNGVDEPQKWDGEAAATVNWTATKGTIPKGGVLCVWENRMCISYVGAQSQRLYFSEFSDPEATIAEYGFVDIRGSEEDLDSIQDLAVLGSRLIILKRRGVFFVSSAVTFLNRHIGGPGAWGRFMTAELENKLYFFNPQGVFFTGGVEVQMESGSINNLFKNYSNQSGPALIGARMIATKDTYPRLLLALPLGVGGGSKVNDILYEMVPKINFRRIGGRRYLLLPAFMRHTIHADALACWNPNGTEEQIIAISPGKGATPNLPVTDSLARAAESPLSNGAKWSKWAWCAAAGALIEEAAEKGIGAITAKALEGARWNVAQFEKPQVQMGLQHIEGPITVGDYIALNACYDVAARSGYTARFEMTASEPITITIEKWVAGVKTVLATAKNFGFATGMDKEIAFTVIEGKLRVWKNDGAWEEMLSATDATYFTGYSGFEIKSSEAKKITKGFALGPFRTATVEAEVEHIYKLFGRLATTDDGEPIIAHWKSSWIPVQEEEPKERLRRINIELSGNAVIDVFTDFEEAPRFTQELPKAGDLKEFNEPNTPEYRFTRVRPETHGRSHQIQFRSNAAGDPFQINTVELRTRGGKEH